MNAAIEELNKALEELATEMKRLETNCAGMQHHQEQLLSLCATWTKWIEHSRDVRPRTLTTGTLPTTTS